MSGNVLSDALGYASTGVAVFPVNTRKEPLTGLGGFHHATTDRAQIEAWWNEHPDAGIATPDFDVVDVDLYKPDCEGTWRRIRSLVGDGPHQRTPRGGLQYLYAPGTLRRAKIGPGVDNRYAGANYVLLPPSRFIWAEGVGCYEWIVPLLGHKPKAAPDFPVDANGGGTASELVRKIKTGERIDEDRNTSAFWYAVGLLDRHPELSRAAVEARTQAFVDVDCGGNLAEVDVPKQVRGAFKFYADKQPRPEVGTRPDDIDLDGPPEQAGATPRLRLRNLSGYDVRRVKWLEKPFWQAGAFHLLGGRKGSCKGTLLARQTARVTTGDLYGSPKRVLVITSEDSIELDFKPRVLAAGGDPNLVEIIVGPFKLPDDIAWIKAQALALGDVGLVILDPIGNHTGGRNTDQEGPIRDAIQDLNPLADELDCMVVGVRHLGKDASRGALASVLGSTAFVDVPRCVILMAADDEDEFLFHAQVVAGNRGPRSSAGQAFRLELVDVDPAEEITRLTLTGASSKDVNDLLGVQASKGDESKTARARELILDILEDGDKLESDALDARVAKETNLTVRTVRNTRSGLAKEGLIQPYPEKDEFGEIVCWKVYRTAAPR